MTNQQILDLNILDALGLSGLADDQKAQLISNITTLVQKSAMITVYERLSKEDQKALDDLVKVKGSDHADVVAFIAERVPDIANIFEEELIKVKQDLIQQVTGKTAVSMANAKARKN